MVAERSPGAQISESKAPGSRGSKPPWMWPLANRELLSLRTTAAGQSARKRRPLRRRGGRGGLRERSSPTWPAGEVGVFLGESWLLEHAQGRVRRAQGRERGEREPERVPTSNARRNPGRRGSAETGINCQYQHVQWVAGQMWAKMVRGGFRPTLAHLSQVVRGPAEQVIRGL